MPAAIAHEVDLALANTGDTSTQAEDDFVGEPVRDQACAFRGRAIGVLLSKHLRGCRVLHVIKPAVDQHIVGGDPKIAKGEHGSIGRRPVPCLKANL